MQKLRSKLKVSFSLKLRARMLEKPSMDSMGICIRATAKIALESAIDALKIFRECVQDLRLVSRLFNMYIFVIIDSNVANNANGHFMSFMWLVCLMGVSP